MIQRQLAGAVQEWNQEQQPPELVLDEPLGLQCRVGDDGNDVEHCKRRGAEPPRQPDGEQCREPELRKGGEIGRHLRRQKRDLVLVI